MTELPVAGYTPPPPPPVERDITDVVADIAEAIVPENPLGNVSVRVGTVTAVETSGQYRVKLDISSTAWLARTADAHLSVGDRAWAVQQGAVLIVGGRINAPSALVPIGTVISFAGSAAPMGWLFADGSAVSRTTYAALFAVVGTTYGSGNGSTTFNVPNLEDRFPLGSGGSYTRGTTGGTDSVTLSASQVPSHNHSFSATSGSGGSHDHSGTASSAGSHTHSYTNASPTRSDILAGGGTTCNNGSTSSSTGSGGDHSHSLSIDSASTHTHSMSGTTGSSGSGSAHENMPPYVAMPYLVRAL